MASKKKSLLEQIQKDRRKEETVDDILHPERSSILAQAEARKEAKAEPKKKYTPQIRTKESRSRRLQLLLTPSLYAKVDRKAKRLGVSVNELINTVLEDVIED